MSADIKLLENQVIKIAECLVLTGYADNSSIPLKLREEGLAHRHFLLSLLIKYCVVLFELQTCHE